MIKIVYRSLSRSYHVAYLNSIIRKMSSKTLENCVRELHKTVLELQNKVNSLESVIIEQNLLIKKFTQSSSVFNTEVVSKNTVSKSEENDGTLKKRPVRMTRLRATSSTLGSKLKVQAGSNDASATPSPVPNPARASPPPITPPPNTSRGKAAVTLNASAAIAKKSDDREENVEWSEVTNRRATRSQRTSQYSIARGTAAPGSTTLEASERKFYLHVYYLKAGTTVEQMITHLLSICPNDTCFVEQLKSRGDYASFKITVPTKNKDLYMSPTNWAEDVHIKPWRGGFRGPKTPAQNS